jgi:predicted transcriptional regulator
MVLGLSATVEIKKGCGGLGERERAMSIEIRDAAIEARLKKQLQATGSGSVEEVLNRLLDTQEEQDRWVLENREMIRAKIRRGMEQLDRGEGIPEERLRAHLAELKAKPE